MKNYILNKQTAEKKLRRIALEIIERNYDETELVLIGIKEHGLVLAKKLSAFIAEQYSGKITVLELGLDKRNPVEIRIEPFIDLKDKIVIIADDVANSGKTMLYALKPLLETFPKKIQTMALVERTHKYFPIAIDYTGLSVSTTLDEHIFVEVEGGEVTGAYLEASPDPSEGGEG